MSWYAIKPNQTKSNRTEPNRTEPNIDTYDYNKIELN